MTIVARAEVLPSAKNEGVTKTVTTGDSIQWVLIFSPVPTVLLSYLVLNVGENAVDVTILRSKIPVAKGLEAIDPDDDMWTVILDEDELAAAGQLEAVIDDQHDRVLAIGVASAVSESDSEVIISLGASA